MSLADFYQRFSNRGPQTFPERLLFMVLLPFSLIYGSAGWLRRFCYRRGCLASYQSRLPVISVGNLAVGGTGKTPVVDFLVKTLRRQGWSPAVLSRGYGGTFSGSVGNVSSAQGMLMSARQAGDEPFLLALRNPGCPVVIARSRTQGVREIERTECADLVVLDDGFQHCQLDRRVDMVLLDDRRPLGNGWPLPAGRLREFPWTIDQADIVLMTRAVQLNRRRSIRGRPVFACRYRLADRVQRLDGTEHPKTSLQKLKVFAFAGIADPYAFFAMLKTNGIEPAALTALPDHVVYDRQVLDELRRASAGTDVMLTTEKDAVKLTADMFDLPCFQAPLVIEIGQPDELMEALSRFLEKTRNEHP